MRKKARAVMQKEIHIEREQTALHIDVASVTRLLKSVRVNLIAADNKHNVYESVAIEPLEGSRNFVDLKIYFQNNRKTSTFSPGIVRFYFDGRDPKVVKNMTTTE